MNKPLSPNPSHMAIRWDQLELAWREMATPQKQSSIRSILEDIQTLHQTSGAEAALFDLIAATAWLTDEGTVLNRGWPG